MAEEINRFVSNLLRQPKPSLRESRNPYDVLRNAFPERSPTESELDFFRKSPNVAGYAAPDNTVVLNPFSKGINNDSVLANERIRLAFRGLNIVPSFKLERHQIEALKSSPYGSDESALKQTISSRILSGDPSLAPYSEDQIRESKSLLNRILNNL